MFADFTVASLERAAETAGSPLSDFSFIYNGTYNNAGWIGTLEGTWQAGGVTYQLLDTYAGTVFTGAAAGPGVQDKFVMNSMGNAGFLVGDFTDSATLNQINNNTANFVWTLNYARAFEGTDTFESDPTLSKMKGGGVLVISGKVKGINNFVPLTLSWDFSMKLMEDDMTFTSLNTPIVGLKFPVGFRQTGTYTIPTSSTDGKVTMTISSIPEPSSLTLLGLGMISALWIRRKRV